MVTNFQCTSISRCSYPRQDRAPWSFVSTGRHGASLSETTPGYLTADECPFGESCSAGVKGGGILEPFLSTNYTGDSRKGRKSKRINREKDSCPSSCTSVRKKLLIRTPPHSPYFPVRWSTHNVLPGLYGNRSSVPKDRFGIWNDP